jgi:hypothetical protein
MQTHRQLFWEKFPALLPLPMPYEAWWKTLCCLIPDKKGHHIGYNNFKRIIGV